MKACSWGTFSHSQSPPTEADGAHHHPWFMWEELVTWLIQSLRARTSMLPPSVCAFLQAPHHFLQACLLLTGLRSNCSWARAGDQAQAGISVCVCAFDLPLPLGELRCSASSNPRIPNWPSNQSSGAFFLLPLGYTYSNHFALEYLFIFTWQNVKCYILKNKTSNNQTHYPSQKRVWQQYKTS